MKSNFFTIILIAVIAMLLGVGLSVKLTGDQLLENLVAQQREILVIQKKIDAQMKASDQELGDKFSALEKKVESLAAAIPKQPPMPMPQRPQFDMNQVYEIPVGQSPIRGKAEARVTITGFLDLQCPFCGRFQTVIDQVLAAYPNDVRYVVKAFPLPFHPQAKPAMKAVLAAGEQGKYWEMMGLVFANKENLSEEKYKELAKTLKLNLKKFEADLKAKDADWEKMIQGDYDLGAKVNVQGTPTYYINGKMTNARDLDAFKQEIDKILKAK